MKTVSDKAFREDDTCSENWSAQSALHPNPDAIFPRSTATCLGSSAAEEEWDIEDLARWCSVSFEVVCSPKSQRASWEEKLTLDILDCDLRPSPSSAEKHVEVAYAVG